MKITVKTAGLLGKHLPPGSARNLAVVEVAEGASPLTVIEQLGFPPDANYLVTVNGTIVPPSERPRLQLSDNDQLSVMPPLKGG